MRKGAAAPRTARARPCRDSASPSRRPAFGIFLSRCGYLKRAIDLTSYAREQGLYVIFSPYDTTHCGLHLRAVDRRIFADPAFATAIKPVLLTISLPQVR